MSKDEGPEVRQRTVAELLQQYGDSGRGASRRRRRAVEDDDEPADQGAEPLDRDQTHGSPEATPGSSGDASGSANGGPAAVPRQRWTSGPGQSVDPLTGEPIDPPARADRGGPPTGPGVTGAYPSGRIRAGRSDPPTEQLPRYPGPARDAGPQTGPLTGPVTGPLGWGAARNRHDPDADGPPTGQLSRAGAPGRPDTGPDAGAPAGPDSPTGSAAVDAEDASPLAGAAPAGLAARDNRGEFADRDGAAEEAEGPLGVVGWLKLIGQWLVGAVLGALLWVGFSWLWTNHPVVALIAAVLATVGLVLLVRAIRRSDDLQTTMLAVLVGLVVTISPAVLLLANR